MSSKDYAALLIGILGIPMIAMLRFVLKRSASRLPPSPTGDPFIGHARKVPLEYSWETFSDWKKALGKFPIIYTYLGSTVPLDSQAESYTFTLLVARCRSSARLQLLVTCLRLGEQTSQIDHTRSS